MQTGSLHNTVAGWWSASNRAIGWRKMRELYTVAQKSKPPSFVHIFVKYRPILKIFSLAHSVENL